ncbi:lytic transglycosylase domain-containing protein [Herminiimonas sp. CN]|uniref:lytic transglycosylase domain-containing protein n=1 Tax=Herminiimonas sp. CN TaxID=1349818 RepID=UPI000473B01F|nr:lytic transglycosylase domain-containing protein [Herminiimonas sp. CN]
MFTQITRAMYGYAQKTAVQSAAWAGFARGTTKNYAAVARHAVLILGVLAIGLLGLIFVKPEIADRFTELSPFAEEYETDTTTVVAPQAPSTANPAVTPTIAAIATPKIPALQQKTARAGRPQQASTATSTQQKWVSYWLAKRYRVAGDAIHMLVSTSYQVARELKLDPLLILSVIAIESRFNPLSESPVGAQGLMQVMSNVHKDKFQKHGGVAAALNPVANINVGSRILKEYVVQGGSIEAGLKKYVGASAFDSDFGYGNKVLSEYHYLQQVAMGKKVPAYVTAKTSTPPLPKTVKNNESAELPPTAIDGLPKHKNDQKGLADQVAVL